MLHVRSAVPHLVVTVMAVAQKIVVTQKEVVTPKMVVVLMVVMQRMVVTLFAVYLRANTDSGVRYTFAD
jgi:hypothetical protein